MSSESRKRAREPDDDSELTNNSKNDENEAAGAVEFEVLQAYRNFEDAMTKDKAKATRTGDISIAIKNLDAVDSLFSKVAGTRNNGLFAHDARAIVSISELAQISVRNLKFDDSRSLVNLDDVINSCKKYMLKEYFKINGIVEQVTPVGFEADQNEESEETEGRLQSVSPSRDDGSNRLKVNTIRRSHLEQYSNYKDFFQFNWFRMGALFNKVSKNVATVDHLLATFSLEKKYRAPPRARVREGDNVGLPATAERVLANSSRSKEPSTPDLVWRFFAKLKERKGYDPINLFRFVIDPSSFAKSVENLFYASFLIKENKLVLQEDDDGYPSVRVKESLPNDSTRKDIESQRRRDTHQNHIIFQLDMLTWEQLIQKFSITSAFMDDD